MLIRLATHSNFLDLGLRDRVEMINKDTDLQAFIQAYSVKANIVTKSAAPYQEYLMVSTATVLTIVGGHKTESNFCVLRRCYIVNSSTGDYQPKADFWL
jgi:hypothetical protein